MFWATGEWRIKPGQEDAFVAAWVDLVVWSKGAFPGRRALLLRSSDEAGVFLSVASSPTEDFMEGWRDIPEFQQRLDALQELTISRDVRGFTQIMDVS